MDLKKLVFIDESGAKTDMTRLYGRADASLPRALGESIVRLVSPLL